VEQRQKDVGSNMQWPNMSSAYLMLHICGLWPGESCACHRPPKNLHPEDVHPEDVPEDIPGCLPEVCLPEDPLVSFLSHVRPAPFRFFGMVYCCVICLVGRRENNCLCKPHSCVPCEKKLVHKVRTFFKLVYRVVGYVYKIDVILLMDSYLTVGQNEVVEIVARSK
jgi:hypothetical protein